MIGQASLTRLHPKHQKAADPERGAAWEAEPEQGWEAAMARESAMAQEVEWGVARIVRAAASLRRKS